MADLLNTATSGLLAFQRSLDVTAHNVANANTPGYSRQVAEFSTVPGQNQGNGYVGNGVQVSTVKRIYDQFLSIQLQTAASGQSRLAMMNSLAGQIDGLLADPQTGLSPALQSFFNSVQDVSNDPASLPARQAMIGEAESFLQRLKSIDTRLRQIDGEMNVRLEESVNEVNRLATSIAEVNNEIVLAEGRTGQPPNDLLDQRNRLINELSDLVSISTLEQDDGAVNVFIGTGQTLVLGSRAEALGTVPSDFDPTRRSVVYRTPAGDAPLADAALGGAIGGLLEFRGAVLDPSRQSLGETALGLAVAFNGQHQKGMDLYGNLGVDFFDVAAPTVLTSQQNAGSGSATVSYGDVGALAGSDYILDYDGASYSLRRADNDQAIAMTGSGTVGDPFVAGGLEIVVSGSPAAGDELLIRSALDAAGGLSLGLSDPQAIAIAAPTRSLVDGNNLGDASIGPTEVVDITDPNLQATAVIEFTAPGTYSVDGAGAFAYTAGDPIIVNGNQFAIEGSPEVGDRFIIEANIGAQGDNRNGLELSSLQTTGVLNGGTVTINESYASLIADVGNSASRIQSNLDAQTVLRDNVESSIAAKSGVNLDEEAANLIRFQQAYEAMARVVAVTGTLFDTLIGAVRR